MSVRRFLWILLVVFASVFFVFTYHFYNGINYLTFSDGAKFADIARSLVVGKGYTSSFNFWGGNNAQWISPAMPLSIALFFKIFRVNDFAVLATSGFYYILLVVFVYLLGKKLFGNLCGVLSAVAVLTNLSILNYATSGASELLFIFEIVFILWLTTYKKKVADVVGLIFLLLMYFTRPQAFIYIVGVVIYYLFSRFEVKKAFRYLVVVLLLGLALDQFVLAQINGSYFLYSVFSRGQTSLSEAVGSTATSFSIRGGVMSPSLIQITKKVFYNLYNFYKLIPQIMSPYLFALFVVGLFRWTKNKTHNAFKLASVFMVFTTFVLTAFTIPFFRYIHPVIPLVYIIAVDTLVWVVFEALTNKRLALLSASFLLLFFVVGQALGAIFLDSRFERNTHNVDKPPVYVKLSWALKENINDDQVVVTNLDTWGSWYGERRTIWFPLEPGQLGTVDNGGYRVDAIYLTNYLIDDENNYMDSEWRQILNDPQNIKEGYIKENFKFVKEIIIPSSETYEKQEGRGVLLVRK